MLRVVRLCSVFEAPAAALRGRGARFDPVGGMQNHTACLTRALDAAGVDQDVVTTRPPGAAAEEVLGLAARIHRRGLPVHVARQGYAVPAAAVLRRVCRGADVLHAHLGEDLAVVPLALAAARGAGIPLVLTVHMSLVHTLPASGARGRVLHVAGGRLERAGVRHAHAVIALTRRLAGVLEARAAARRVHVIPSGVVPADFAGARPSEAVAAVPRPRVVFVGRLAQQKGVDTLLEAAARLPAASIVLAGDGPRRALLERRAADLGIAGRVRFLGFRPHDEVPAILAAADVLVLPSRYEELGSVLLEAMQAGVPIVASDTGGIPEALGPAGVLVPPGDAPALAAAVDRVLGDPALAVRLRAAARARAHRYDWTALARRVLAVYDGVVAGAEAAVAPVAAAVPEPTPAATA